MATTLPPSAPPSDAPSRDEARRFFDAQARALLAISGDEFLRRLDAGAYADVPDDAEHADVVYLATMQSLGRRDA